MIAPLLRPAAASRALLRASSTSATLSQVQVQRRGVATLKDVKYTAHATASGAGRNGRTKCEENGLDLQLA